MTVNTTTSRVAYAGNGSTTVFAIPFYFLSSSDLTVIRTASTGAQTTLVLNTDYTVSGAGVPAGGSVTCTVAPAVGQSLVIFRDPAATQLTDYQPNDPFPAETHERALDKLTMIAQRLKDLVTRSFTLSDGDVSGANTTLPSPSANKLIGWDTNALALQNVDPATLLTIVGSSGFVVQTFSGTGAQTAFTLSANPGVIANLEVYISGVRKVPTSDYTISGTTLTFTSAPPSGTNNILVRWGQTLGIGVPSDGSVTTAKLAFDGGALASRNRIINGNFAVNQRGVSGTVTLSAGAYGHDRWKAGASGCTYTFATSGGATTLTITAGSLQQVIEDVNVPLGTNTCVLSWSGTAQGKIGGGSFSASGTTASVTGGSSLTIEFNTGTLSRVQFEQGSTATPFEHRSYALELALCQRYYEETGSGDGTIGVFGYNLSSNSIYAMVPYKVTKRGTTTVTVVGTWSTSNMGQPTVSNISTSNCLMAASITSTGTGFSYNATAGNKLTFSAEL